MDIVNLQEHYVTKIYQLEKICYPNEFLSVNQIQSYITDFAKNGLLIKDNEFIIGYSIVINDDTEIDLRLGIHPQYRRLQHATRLLNKVKSKLNHSKNILKCWVPEDNLDGQLFLRSHGFICTKTDNTHYKRRKTPGYMFIYRLEWGFNEQNGILVPDELELGLDAV